MQIYQAYNYHLHKNLLLKCEMLMSGQQSVRITLISNFNFSLHPVEQILIKYGKICKWYVN